MIGVTRSMAGWLDADAHDVALGDWLLNDRQWGLDSRAALRMAKRRRPRGDKERALGGWGLAGLVWWISSNTGFDRIGAVDDGGDDDDEGGGYGGNDTRDGKPETPGGLPPHVPLEPEVPGPPPSGGGGGWTDTDDAGFADTCALMCDVCAAMPPCDRSGQCFSYCGCDAVHPTDLPAGDPDGDMCDTGGDDGDDDEGGFGVPAADVYL